MNAVA